jgi:hypothetical protein
VTLFVITALVFCVMKTMAEAIGAMAERPRFVSPFSRAINAVIYALAAVWALMLLG